MELTVLIPVMLIIFLAAVVMGVTSFGFALIAVPLLNLLLPLKVLVPVLILYLFAQRQFTEGIATTRLKG